MKHVKTFESFLSEAGNRGETIFVSSHDNFKVKHGGKTWEVEYDNHEEGDEINLTSGNDKITGVVKKVSPNGDLTIELTA